MFADDFLLGQSVHLQKQSFKSFLQKGLIEEFQNFFPFITSFGRESQINETSTSHQSHTVTRSVSDIRSPLASLENYVPYTSRDTYQKNTFVFFLDVQNYVLKKPKISAQKALQSGETYKAEIYIPGRWFFNNLPITSTSFLFLGELPLLTEEGHFILNGSPRTVVGQLVRSPGIYYKIKLGRKNRRRHLISFLSENGCWFRIWTDQWGRVWARINKLRRIPLFVLLRSLGFTDSLLIRMISDLSFLWKSYRKFIETYFFANSIHKAILFLYFDLHRSRSKKPVFLHACDFIYRTFFQSKTYSFGKSGRFYLDLKLGRYPQLSQTLKPEDVLDGIEKLIQLESGYCWVDNIDHLQNRRVRLVNELLQNELNRGLKSFQTIYKQKLQTLYLSSIFHDLKLYPVNYTFFKKFYHTFSLRSDQSHTIRESQVSNEYRDLKNPLSLRSRTTYLLPSVAETSLREAKLGVKLCSSSRSVTRRRYIIGERVIKNQKKHLRKKKFFFFKLKKKNDKIPISLGSDQSHIIRYGVLERRERGLIRSPLTSTVCSEETFVPSLKHDSNFFTNRNKELSIKPNGLSTRIYGPHLRSPSTATRLDLFSESEANNGFYEFLLNPHSITKAFQQFFGLHPLSQLLDQSNPLSAAAHKRRLTSLGPGGVNRDAGLAVRDIHPSHYGRLCPIETPEGKNAGLVHSLALYAHLNNLGAVQTPFLVKNKLRETNVNFQNQSKSFLFSSEQEFFLTKGKPIFFGNPFLVKETCTKFSSEARGLYEQSEKAKSLIGKKVASLNKEIYQYNKSSILVPSQIIDRNHSLCRIGEPVSSYNSVPALSDRRDKSPTSLRSYNSVPLFFSVSPTQILSLATSLIPFLEHDDANRALMGSNMQRQAVSLLYPEKPIVGTGFEKIATQGISTKTSGIIYSVNATRILVRTQKRLHIYPFNTFSRSNQATCLEEKPFVKEGEIILKGTSFGDKESTYGGDLSIGTNLLLGYMPWEGYNFEDAVVISERLVIEDVYTSIHIEKYTVNIDKRFGEELTPYPPNIPNDESYHLDNNGIIEKGVFVQKQSLLIGKRKPLDDKKMTPTFKLRAKIFQVKPPFYEDTSFRLMRGSGGRVLRVQLRLDRDSSEAKIETNFAFSKLIYSIKLPTRFARIESPLASLETSHLPVPSGRRDKSHIVKTELNKRSEVRDLSPLTQQNIKYRTKKKKNSRFAKEEKYKFLEYLSFHQRSSFFPKKMSEHKPNQTWIEKENFYEKYNSFSFCYKLNFQINSFFKISHSKQTVFQQKNNVLHSSVSGTLYQKQVFNKRSLESEASPYKYDTCTKFSSKARGIYDHRSEVLERSERELVRSSRPKGEGIDKDIKTIKNIDSIQIFIATKRRIQIGDKVAGRHGNKGIVCLILPQSNMPYLQDGTPLDVVLNPLGVPSRMNLGQLFESLLGLAGKHLRQSYKIVAFDEIHSSLRLNNSVQSCVRGAIDVNPEQYVSSSRAKGEVLRSRPKGEGIDRERQVSSISKNIVLQNCFNAKKKTGYSWLFNSNIPGKMYVFDGRTGRPFLQPIMVGLSYMLKLVHLVDDKIHARLTGPYGLVSQQPLRGKARDGGQRLGEMEVWAFEGYGAAYTLHELLTLKSDDMEARSRLFSSLVKGDSIWGHENTKSYSIFNMMFLRSSSFQFDTINSTLLGDLSLIYDPRTPAGTELNKRSEFREQSKIPINPRQLGTRFAPQASLFQSDRDYIFEKYNKAYQNKKKKKTHNFPESLQVVFSELQALCLDISLIQF
uniref:DNA-directed RNA polymerase subunit beta n=1 Tax=Microrhizoidea pickettheapsiorum TaxID=2604950 RepID=A0A5B9RJN1_9CHLO|nr:RNA polymerase b-subunit [Microrhizoidea pickettheapsiorum]QEG77670.1 RNA polymerase b-subunit [Microrhizoidea pickettheapsiorum]